MTNSNCYACDKLLSPVFEGHGYDNQCDNALEVEFFGGYGMFVDPIDDPYSAVICHECAHDLCDKIPWIKKLIDPHSSHSHKLDFIKENPNHYGWDYDHKDQHGK